MYALLKFEGKERDLKVEIGEKERSLLQYLDQHSHITVKKFAEIAKLKLNIASRTIVHLCKARVLIIQPQVETADRFRLHGFE